MNVLYYCLKSVWSSFSITLMLIHNSFSIIIHCWRFSLGCTTVVFFSVRVNCQDWWNVELCWMTLSLVLYNNVIMLYFPDLDLCYILIPFPWWKEVFRAPSIQCILEWYRSVTLSIRCYSMFQISSLLHAHLDFMKVLSSCLGSVTSFC